MPALITSYSSPEPECSSFELRRKIRRGEIKGSTSGLARTMQANLIVLPSRYAKDFRNLCMRNPVACPLLEYTTPGEYRSRLAAESDLRTDIPAYNVFKDGKLVSRRKSNIIDEWTNDHVGFLIGCSYSFETALKRAGLEPECSKRNLAVPMYVTNIRLNPAGVFSGYYVVSMRSYKPCDIPRVREITGEYIKQHGEPIAWGWEDAERIGVRRKIELDQVDFGDVVPIPEGEIPVFWACGVTPQVAVQESRLKGTVMSHLPGSMFVTDLDPEDESLLL
ncbi:hypothetical protein H072_9659 [Dactylellina haptotyla CBS 200.50]|uniref:DUF1445 domain-containing protein n=1 Tax=Dactylellina haptotyla (strain CBS 200.50) TaxID=1284197 RepID=S8BC48_DACHA|nr:hypothetical protein H072_9659 [Dactylellina haptotyla CBS 200.50]